MQLVLDVFQDLTRRFEIWRLVFPELQSSDRSLDALITLLTRKDFDPSPPSCKQEKSTREALS